MKVGGVGGTKGPSGTKSTQKTGAPGSFSKLLETDGVDEAGGVAATSAVNAVGSILSVQEVGAVNPDGRRRAARRGQDLLDKLDEIRLALLDGRVSLGLLKQIDAILKTQRDGDIDPKLASLLDDIELRAAVELAKLER